MKYPQNNFTLPAWIDRLEYPFQSHFMDIEGHKMHYLDEGSGTVMLMVHGTPDWSFLYRNFVKEFSAQYRCIVPDHLGFGMSDKPQDADYRPEAHAKRLERFIEKLGLKDITLVVHDFGGPIGLSYAINHSDNIRNITNFNTWMWGLKGIKQFDGSKMLHGWLGKLLYLQFNFSARVMIPSSFGVKSRLSKHIHNQYIKALDSPKNRMATYVFAKAVLNSNDWYNSLWAKRENISQKPILIVWGMKDRFFPPEIVLQKWIDNFPNANLVKLPDTGHFPQEESPEASISAMKKFYKNLS